MCVCVDRLSRYSGRTKGRERERMTEFSLERLFSSLETIEANRDVAIFFSASMKKEVNFDDSHDFF